MSILKDKRLLELTELSVLSFIHVLMASLRYHTLDIALKYGVELMIGPFRLLSCVGFKRRPFVPLLSLGQCWSVLCFTKSAVDTYNIRSPPDTVSFCQ